MPKNLTQNHLEELNEALSSGTFPQVRRMLNGLSDANIAALIESSPPKNRKILWNLVDEERHGDILPLLNEEVEAEFLSSLAPDQVAEVTDGLDPDDIADILQQLPDAVIRQVLQAMSEQDRYRVEHMLSYDEDTAGGLMNTDTITVRPRFTLDVVLRYLRMHKELPPTTDSVFVVSSDDHFVGLLPINKIITSNPNITVREVMLTDVEAIPASAPKTEVAQLFERNDWVTAPVIDDTGKLVGRITIDDVVDVIIDEADHSLMSMAGLDEESDTFATAWKTAPRRAVWLGINLMTAFIASSVINIFQGTIEKVVALAILMPIVASMGGIAGNQTLTLIIRSMALGQVSRNNAFWLFNREVQVGIMNGALWAMVVGCTVSVLFEDYRIGLSIGLAMIINLVTAAAMGSLLPLLLKKLRIDPALAGGVILTTMTDVVGFMSFLGIATLFFA